MKHESQAQFGQQMTAVQTDDTTLVDKWAALQSLSDAAETFDLNHRTLGVLRALLSFHRDRLIGPEHLSAVVFASNKALSRRLNGMPDSTLRRHLARLVTLGIVNRHDSANRKRFVRAQGQGAQIAFGFDLSPLASNHALIAEAAETARMTHNALQALRDKLAQLRQRKLDQTGMCALTEAARLALRRKPDAASLSALCTDLEDTLEPTVPNELSIQTVQNERHIQTESLTYSDSETDDVSNDVTSSKAPALADLLHTCKEYRLYFTEPVRTWNEALSIASRLSQMMGIDPPVFHHALDRIGHKNTITVILCLLENLPDIHNPGGYLHRLAQTAGAGGFCGVSMLNAVRNRLKLSADNLISV